jgi:hypothetical protein
MKNHPTPTALARIAYRKTSDGKPILKVSVISPDVPDGIAFRTYIHTPGCDTDKVVSRALKSCGLASAWTWAALPVSPKK